MPRRAAAERIARPAADSTPTAGAETASSIKSQLSANMRQSKWVSENTKLPLSTATINKSRDALVTPVLSFRRVYQSVPEINISKNSTSKNEALHPDSGLNVNSADLTAFVLRLSKKAFPFTVSSDGCPSIAVKRPTRPSSQFVSP